MQTNTSENGARQAWMGLFAVTPAARLRAVWDDLQDRPEFTFLRAPEIGLVMTRGRIGGSGGPFNMGEMTVTRCSVRLTEPAIVGHAYLAGRDRGKAEIAAVLDAMLQAPGRWPDLHDRVVGPLAAERGARDRARAAKVASTKVDFFTMVRGED